MAFLFVMFVRLLPHTHRYCVKTTELISSYSSEQEQERLVVFAEPLSLCDAAENIHIYCDLFSSVVWLLYWVH